ncbi:MAG: hypothetical protein Q8P10_00055 [bacterium]|nr:hypothetical protein [bacterium]
MDAGEEPVKKTPWEKLVRETAAKIEYLEAREMARQGSKKDKVQYCNPLLN